MKRRFLLAGMTAVFATNQVNFGTDLFGHKSSEVALPSFGNDLIVTLDPVEFSGTGSAKAQFYSYYSDPYAYQRMLEHQNYLAYQQAVARWNQLMMQRAAHHAWLQQQHFLAVQQVMRARAQYEYGDPEVWGNIRSIYGLGRTPTNNSPILVGANESAEQVVISKTLKAAGSVFDRVGQYFDREEQERVVGPQSNEVVAHITLPDGSLLPGNAYTTKNGALGVTDGKVKTADGRIGELAKFKLSDDGEQYLVI